MRKNTASQTIGAQVINATTGAAFTGSVTAIVTGDGGTQGGGGACTHEGNGFHTYLPTQAETNYDHVAFTFTGSGAIPVTVQVYTTFPQTGDSFGLIGATGSGLTSLATQASVNTIDDFLDTEIAAIKTKTDFLPSATAGDAGGLFIAGTNAPTTITTALTTTFTGNLTGSVASVTGAVGSVTGAVGSVTGLTAATVHSDLDDIQARIPAALTGAGNMKSDALAINGNTTAAAVLAILNGANVVYQGTVTGAATTTTLIDSGLTQAADGWWIGRIIIFTSVIAMQATDITGFTAATDTLTFTAVTSAPTGATYVII